MITYQLYDQNKQPLLKLQAEDDGELETDLILFASAISGIGGYSEVEKKEEYWRITHHRRGGNKKYLYVKRSTTQMQ